MKWINPRDRLPEEGQIVWALKINKREEEGRFPSACIIISEAKKDSFGVIFLEQIDGKGFSEGEICYFYNWNYEKTFFPKDWYSAVEIKDDMEIHYRWDCVVVEAWYPYDGLPEWERISALESIEILRKSDEFNKEFSSRGSTQRPPSETQFVSIYSSTPPDGIYFIMAGDTVYRCMYRGQIPWLAPNGKAVEAWCPVPQAYHKE